MEPCTHKSEMIVCRHVTQEGAEVEVLLVTEKLQVDYALCLNCGMAEEPEALPFDALCRACAVTLNIPAMLPTPGRWQVGVNVEGAN